MTRLQLLFLFLVAVGALGGFRGAPQGAGNTATTAAGASGFGGPGVRAGGFFLSPVRSTKSLPSPDGRRCFWTPVRGTRADRDPLFSRSVPFGGHIRDSNGSGG